MLYNNNYSIMSKEFIGGILGIGVVVLSIIFGLAEIVAPAMIIAYVLYMILGKSN